MTINIEYDTEKELHLPYEDIIRKVILKAIDFEKCPFDLEVNVTLTDNESIHAVNKEFRDVDRPTDVLSFPMLEYPTPADFTSAKVDIDASPEDYINPDSDEIMLGDIMISVEKVQEQAASYCHSEERELAFLVAHSMLHLFGYDHMEDEEREVMEARQKQMLDEMGITR